jgi:adenine-specific DNA methylase
LRIVPNAKGKRVDFEIIEKKGREWTAQDDPETVIRNPQFEGTVKRGSATCPCCGYTTPVASVRRQMKTRRGGAADARLFCVVTTRPVEQGRFYRLPTKHDLKAVTRAQAELEKRMLEPRDGLSLVPDEPTPQGGGSGAGRAFSQRNYGMDSFADLFTPRQLLALTTLSRFVREVPQQMDQAWTKESLKREKAGIGCGFGDNIIREEIAELASVIQTVLALAIDRCTNQFASLSKWNAGRELVDGVFARQALPMLWDFGEINPLGSDDGYWTGAINWIIAVIESSLLPFGGQAELTSATKHPLPDDSAQAFISDPPYYDAVPYSDLSDFFYVWLKRTLPASVAEPFANQLTPKADKCIVDEVKGKDRAYFERTMAQAMAEGRRILHPAGIGLIVFAHKSTSGWEAQLQAMVDAGWTMTGSWPIDTEMGTRLRAQDSAALASSVHLVCRPRENPDGSLRADDTGDWRDVLQELPRRIHEWMPRLAAEGVVGADAIFACLGPALEVFSRYARVEKASGEVVTLREYLEHVWAAVAKEALQMIFAGADATGFEEDARLTAMWFWTLNTKDEGGMMNDESGDEPESEDDEETASAKTAKVKGYTLEYDAARKIAQGLGAHLEQLDTIVEVKGDKARLLSVAERARHLFGKQDLDASPARKKKQPQKELFDMQKFEVEDGGAPIKLQAGTTALDRVHQAMLLFSAGRSEALKRFLVEDGVGRDQRFWRLAQVQAALYPTGTDERRWVEGVLARKKGLGF